MLLLKQTVMHAHNLHEGLLDYVKCKCGMCLALKTLKN